jgi:serine phosphatase RsbU (regulator of sigma subunit)
MPASYGTPRELVEALERRDDAARPELWRWVREPIARLMDEILTRQRLPHARERLINHALHSAETFLRTRPHHEFAAMNWPAFRAAVLLHVAKQVSQPFVAQAAGPPGPAPLPESPLYHSKAVSLPCERVGNHWYGGDWYAGRHAPDGSLWVIVADITGHGYYAYLMASNLPAVWQACWNDRPPDDLQPADLLAAMHRLLHDCLPDGVFVECTLVRLAPDGEATIAPAGSSRVLLRRGGAAQPDLLKLRGTWLGLKAPTQGDQRTWRLDAGDELLIGTDGVFDQLAEHHGAEVTDILSDVPETRTLLDELQRHLRDVLRSAPQKDDITMVLLRRRGAEGVREALGTAAGNGADDVPV